MTTIEISSHVFTISQEEDGKDSMWCLCYEAGNDEDRCYGYFNVLDVYNENEKDQIELPSGLLYTTSGSHLSLDEWDNSDEEKSDKNEGLDEPYKSIAAKQCPYCYMPFKYEPILESLNAEAALEEISWEDIEIFKHAAPKSWRKKTIHVPKPIQLMIKEKPQLMAGRIVSWGSMAELAEP